jgi:hypothetical protein
MISHFACYEHGKNTLYVGANEPGTSGALSRFLMSAIEEELVLK